MTDTTEEAFEARARAIFEQSAAVKQAVAASDAPARLAEMARACADAIKSGGKVMFCGNGGSAADAQHIAAELIVRLRSDRDRGALPALTLAQDASTMTACANDYGYDQVFARTLEALGRKGDVLVGITTSGNSANVIKAMEAAQDKGITVFGFLGDDGGQALALCELAFIPEGATDTGRIQEAHITAGHALVELIEDALI